MTLRRPRRPQLRTRVLAGVLLLVPDIGRAIEVHANAENFDVVRAFVGHGIGEQFHTDIQVLHYYDERASTIMRSA